MEQTKSLSWPKLVLTGCWITSFIVGCTTLKKETVVSGDSATKREVTPLHTTMYEIASNVLQLQTFAISEEKFQDKKNRAEIQSLVDYLAGSAAKVLREKRIQSPAYRVSGESLERHVKEIKSVYKAGNYSYARSLVLATPMACASCHTQLPNSPTPLWQLSKDEIAGTPFERAELLYATRNYDPALELYSEVIRNPENLKDQNIRLALKRKLTILLRVKRDFAAAKESLDADTKNKAIPTYIKREIAVWQKTLNTELKRKKLVKAEKSISALLAKSEDVFSATGSYLSDSLVEKLYLSGLLYQAIHEHSQDNKTQELLYWLGTSDAAVNNDVLFGLSFAYFRECIDKAPSSMVAKRCFNQYESNMKEMYSGTRGYDPPLEVEEDLKELRMRVGLDQI